MSLQKGCILECDGPMKEFVLDLRRKRAVFGGEDFVLHDLGPVGLFINPLALPEIQARIEAMLDSIAFREKDEDT
eukprot:m.92768 g.92768  ORF g.92768 m.92768 type:complete len:75 (+) comp51175_c0_seq1:50-274(+)